jgi:hypothetical protein
MKILKRIYLSASPAPWEEDGYEYSIVDFEREGRIAVSSMEVTMEVPEGFDLNTGQIDMLKTEKQKILAEAGLKAANIEDQIQRLLFIEHRGEE